MTSMFNTAPEAWEIFQDHPLVLLLMPVVGGFIGWITKVLAIEMIFRPLEYKGIGPIGWQGQLPRRAAKFGSHAAEIILGNVVDPRELIERIDPGQLFVELDEVMTDVLDDIARDITGDAWDLVPARAKAMVMARARSRGPVVADRLLDQVKDNLDEMFDLSHIVTSTLISDKRLLNDFLRGPLEPAFRFMKVFGLLFGAAVGGLQMVVFAFTESHLVVPIAGLIVGLVPDWIALKMLLGPLEERRYFWGLFRWEGLAYQIRPTLLPELAQFAANEILTPKVVAGAILDSALADRLFGMVRTEIGLAVDAELGLLRPVAPLVIGSTRYRALREAFVSSARQRLPAVAERVEPYAKEALAVEDTITETLGAMSNAELESMLRPVFKDDEWLVVVLGGLLGFVVGELQIYLLTTLGGL